MSVRSKHLKVVGAMGAAALTIGGLAAPALAADHDLTYSCTGDPVPLGDVASTLNPGSIPAAMTAGQSAKRSMTLVVHLNQTQTGIAQAAGTNVNGKVTSTGPLSFNLTIPNTAIPPGLGATMDATATGKGTITPNKAGSFVLKAGKINATLHLTGGVGGATTAKQSCTAPTNSTKNLGTITVSKDKSKTSASGSYSAKKQKSTLKSRVKGAKFGLAGTGKVSFTLKKGSHKVGSATGTLKKGLAKVSIKKKLAKGTYTVTTKFKGDGGLKGSSGKGTFKVK